MLRRIWFVLFIFTFYLAPATRAQQPATQPASQPAMTDDQAKSLYESFVQTRFGGILQGKTKLTWETFRDPIFWTDTIKELIVTLFLFIPRLVGTLIFLLIFWLIYRAIRKGVMASIKADEVDSSISNLLGAMIKWLVMGFGIVIACNQLGIPIVAMLTGVSLIGLAIGFAAQETLANFIAGIVIFLDKPFRIGDWVELHDTFGQVRRVSFRSTRIVTGNGEVVVLPNTQVLSSKLTNHSTNPINRVSIPFGIAYKASIDDARRVLLDLTRDDSRLLKEPAPEVVVKSLGDSSVNLMLRFWIEDESIEGKLVSEYTEKAKKALDAAGIEIPFPHMQLFIESTPAVAALAGNGRGIN